MTSAQSREDPRWYGGAANISASRVLLRSGVCLAVQVDTGHRQGSNPSDCEVCTKSSDEFCRQ